MPPARALSNPDSARESGLSSSRSEAVGIPACSSIRAGSYPVLGYTDCSIQQEARHRSLLRITTVRIVGRRGELVKANFLGIRYKTSEMMSSGIFQENRTGIIFGIHLTSGDGINQNNEVS